MSEQTPTFDRLLPQLPLGVVRASAPQPARVCLASGHRELDAFLEGGLPVGALTECGLPLGLGGRRVILQFLAAASQSRGGAPGQPLLWVYPESPLYAFPPAWAAQGVDLAMIGFVRTDHPVRDLKPAFLDPLYRVIVLDFPTHLSRDDLAFLARQARAQGRVILVLRRDWLLEERGNVWARLRLNCRRDPQHSGRFEVVVVRGLSPRRCVVCLDGGGNP